jgi:hypothetical protein
VSAAVTPQRLEPLEARGPDERAASRQSTVPRQ